MLVPYKCFPVLLLWSKADIYIYIYNLKLYDKKEIIGKQNDYCVLINEHTQNMIPKVYVSDGITESVHKLMGSYDIHEPQYKLLLKKAWLC